MTPVFETERLFALRRWLPEHAPAALTLYGDPEVVRYIGGLLVPDLEAMRARIQVLADKYARYGDLLVGGFPVAEKATGDLVGTALLKFLPAKDASGALVDTADLEIGWHLARRAWGRGYATEMGRALLALGFAHHRTDVLHAVVEPPNARSMAVARRIGMEHVGRTDRWYGLEMEHFVARRPPR